MRNQFKSTMNNTQRPLISIKMRQRLQEGFFLITIASAVFLLVSLISYQNSDHGWSNTGMSHHVQNWGGRIGAWLADVSLSLFGIAAYFFSGLAILTCFLRLHPAESPGKHRSEYVYRFLGWVAFISSSCALMHFYAPTFTYLPAKAGGIVGDILWQGLSRFCNAIGSTLLFITILLCGLTLITGVSWSGLVAFIAKQFILIWRSICIIYLPWIFKSLWIVTKYALKECADLFNIALKHEVIQPTKPLNTLSKVKEKDLEIPIKIEPTLNKIEPTFNHSLTMPISISSEEPTSKPFITPIASSRSLSSSPTIATVASAPIQHEKTPLSISEKKTTSIQKIAQKTLSQQVEQKNVLPLPDLLPTHTLLNATPVIQKKAFSHLNLEELAQLVEQRLFDFGITVTVVSVLPGPVITRFELELAPGIKVSKITSLTKDIARSLSVISVRVVEVIPGKSVIGLEIPNEHRELVTLRDIIKSKAFKEAHSPVSLVLGKDISGNPVIVDLAKMPHLLVAGTTGSGKSVGLNAMLLSMLFKTPSQKLRFIMIDPKILELSIYDGIPHLFAPVITDMKDAAQALRWCVMEMDRRYRLMAALGVRNLASYNQMVEDAIKTGTPLTIPHVLTEDSLSTQNRLETLPMIAVIIDELADLMMVVGKKVEDYIARLAQKARAAGIHLIIATQRPSVDVITGLIKANIPTRIAFQVSSRIDSRTILDQQGAEQLLGQGDMLYLPPGAGIPIRVHGAYVADEEVHRVVAALRASDVPHYITDITNESLVNNAEDDDGNESSGSEQDPLYLQALKIVMSNQRASISLIQRRLRIGYNRAARLMETMEAEGIVSTADHNGLREVIASSLPDE